MEDWTISFTEKELIAVHDALMELTNRDDDPAARSAFSKVSTAGTGIVNREIAGRTD